MILIAKKPNDRFLKMQAIRANIAADIRRQNKSHKSISASRPELRRDAMRALNQQPQPWLSVNRTSQNVT